MWYEKVVECGPEMEAYFSEILACNYARGLPYNTYLLPIQGTKNSYLLVQKLFGSIFFCPKCSEYDTIQNLGEQIDYENMKKNILYPL